MPTAIVDPELVNRVCDNLLDNAVKYSPADSPIILSLVTEDDVEIADFGGGVPEEDLTPLFAPFFRSDRSRSRRTGGSGLGLTLCRRIIEAHGGTIAARLNQKGGMTFSFELPVSGEAVESGNNQE